MSTSASKVESQVTSRSTIRITPQADAREYWRMCWDYRELLFFLARRDLVVRYRQTIAGLLWLLVRPMAQVFAFTVLFGYLAEFESDGMPYPVLVWSGVVAWTFFAAIVNQSTISLTNNASLITKVHFPRILLPVGTIAPNLVDLTINVAALFVVMALYGQFPSWRLVLVPVPLVLVALCALGLGLWFSAGCVRYRDFRQLAPFFLQILYLFTPVGFTTTVVRERFSDFWLNVYYANPMVAAVDLFRWCVHPAGYAPPQNLHHILLGLAASLILVLFGQKYFRSCERVFADVI